jgi:hypothetical protein
VRGQRRSVYVALACTLALVIFGYCPMARLLSLLPWNPYEPITMDLLRRTFRSRPDLTRVDEMSHSACPGGG